MTEYAPALSPENLGLLPHEAVFITRALDRAVAQRNAANQTYGEAVENSGGDWAFDDAGSQYAVEAANFHDKDVATLEELQFVEKDRGLVEYPDTESPAAAIGSRVTIEDNFGEEVFDIGTRTIPGLEPDETVVPLSPASPLGAALLGKETGEKVGWQTPNGTVLSATITAINQEAQKQYYNNGEQSE